MIISLQIKDHYTLSDIVVRKTGGPPYHCYHYPCCQFLDTTLTETLKNLAIFIYKVILNMREKIIPLH